MYIKWISRSARNTEIEKSVEHVKSIWVYFRYSYYSDDIACLVLFLIGYHIFHRRTAAAPNYQ